MRSLRAAAAFLALAAPVQAQDTFVVTTAEDSGDGSLRAALEAASAAGGPATIVILAEDAILLDSGLTYDGTAPLAIFGNRTEIISRVNETLLTATQGADLFLRNLSFQGPGGFSIAARGDTEGPAGKGIFVDLRDDQTGTVTLELENLRVMDVAGHGVHVSDCSLADDCGGGGGGAGDGSPASIVVRTLGVEVLNVGLGRFDADGLRVDERGAGDIHFTAVTSRFADVGADGVELDEGQAGDVVVRVIGSAFENNGYYCDPSLLEAFLPAEAEGEFAPGAMVADAIPGPVTGSPDDRCFEREVDTHDDGSVAAYAFAIDVDDGFDIDEAGEGDIRAVVERSGIIGNYDEGLDFDEEDAGDIVLTLIGTVGRDNTDDAYKSSEEGPGDVIGAMVSVVADGNGGVGAVFEEADDGDVKVTGMRVRTQFNDDGETGLEVVQEDAGSGTLTLTEAQIDDGIATEGVEVVE
jgi:hypothetical protein